MALEQYPELAEPFVAFLSKTIKNLVRSQSIAQIFKVREYPGSRYEEMVNGEPMQVEMKAYDTKFLLKGESIKNMDLISIRKEIYEGCKKTGGELDKDLIQIIQKSTTTIDVKGDSFLGAFLESISEIKRKGENPLVIMHPDTIKKLYEETCKPENKEKLYKYRKEFGYEYEETK